MINKQQLKMSIVFEHDETCNGYDCSCIDIEKTDLSSCEIKRVSIKTTSFTLTQTKKVNEWGRLSWSRSSHIPLITSYNVDIYTDYNNIIHLFIKVTRNQGDELSINCYYSNVETHREAFCILDHIKEDLRLLQRLDLTRFRCLDSTGNNQTNFGVTNYKKIDEVALYNMKNKIKEMSEVNDISTKYWEFN